MASQNTLPLTAEQAMQLLEKFGISQFLNNGGVNNANGSVNVDGLQVGPNADQLDLLNHHENFVPPPGFGQVNQGAATFNTTTSFSPFSPDPGFVPDAVKRDGVSPNQVQSFSYASKGFTPWYNSAQQDEKVVAPNSSGKVSPPTAQTSRPASARAFSNFLGEAPNPSSSFEASRASSRQEAPIARPEMSRRPSQTLQSQTHFALNPAEREHDPIQDLNGTLASLNLDSPRLRASQIIQAPSAAPAASPTKGTRPMIVSSPTGRLMPGTTNRCSSNCSIASMRRLTEAGSRPSGRLLNMAGSIRRSMPICRPGTSITCTPTR